MEGSSSSSRAARESSSEREPLSSTQDDTIRAVRSMEVPAASPGGSAKPMEKKLHHAQPKSSIVPASHHRSSHSSERQSGALDLQSLVGRSGSSSSISGITVPIRLDALSYLLNNAVLGAYKVPSQMPCYPPMYPACPYTPMGYSYGTCMSSPSCSVPYMNQLPACQPGLMYCGTQQGIQGSQTPMPNFNQYMGGTTPSQPQTVFSSIQPQSGTSFSNSLLSTIPSVQDNRATPQSDSNTWPGKANDGFGNDKSNPFSSDPEKQSSQPQQGFVRFADKQNEDSWSNRPQNSFNRASGRGKGDFGRSWQGNANGQERRFGDRSWNADSGGRRRFQDSPDRGNTFKRGRWQDGRGRDGENRDSWQPRNRQSFTSSWSKPGTSQDRFKPSEEEKVIAKTDQLNAQDEDWEMDYTAEPAAAKASDQSSKLSLPHSSKICGSPKIFKPSDKSVNREDVVKGFATSLVQEKEEEWDSSSDKGSLKMMEVKPQIKDQDSPEKIVVVGEEGSVENACTDTVSGDDDKGILVEVDPDGQ